jgi:ADP-heptose:LPS heptosyltransferase
MIMSVLKEVKRRNPRCRLVYLSRFPELFESNPSIDELVKFTPENSVWAHRTDYDELGVRPPRPLVTLIAEHLGMRFFTPKVEFAPPGVTESFRQEIAALPRPLVVVQSAGAGFLPNKEWLPDRWVALVQTLANHAFVVEVGKNPMVGGASSPARCKSYAGCTSLKEFLYLISRADVFVGPVSSGMHAANAFGVPSVIIFGGYESPDSHRYANVEAFYTPVPCAPCWLHAPCPYGMKCMDQITVEQVAAAVMRKLLRGTSSLRYTAPRSQELEVRSDR